jgi:type I protein arginine methyltransferase
MHYSIQQFGHMISDTVRMNAFTEALRRSLPPGGVVVDIGAGMGIFALLACQMGARRVYAIESNALVELGEQMAAVNGFADRIVFIREMSTKVELPEQADVIISDLRGQLPLYHYAISSLLDARRRLLKPGGVMIPTRDRLYVAVTSAPKVYHRALVEPWVENPYGLDMSAVLPILVNQRVEDRELPLVFLTPPQEWVSLEYGYREDPNVVKTMEWVVETEGVADFVTVWFDAELFEDVGYSNSPANQGPKIYGHAMLPLERPVPLVPGDRVSVKLTALLVAGSYQYAWETRVASGADGRIKANYQQSGLFATTLSEMRKSASRYVPRLGREGAWTRFVLNGMSEGKALEVIAQELQGAFPEEFSNERDALSAVSGLSQRYSE